MPPNPIPPVAASCESAALPVSRIPRPSAGRDDFHVVPLFLPFESGKSTAPHPTQLHLLPNATFRWRHRPPIHRLTEPYRSSTFSYCHPQSIHLAHVISNRKTDDPCAQRLHSRNPISMKPCRYCGQQNQDDAAQCVGCATPFPSEAAPTPDVLPLATLPRSVSLRVKWALFLFAWSIVALLLAEPGNIPAVLVFPLGLIAILPRGEEKPSWPS